MTGRAGRRAKCRPRVTQHFLACLRVGWGGGCSALRFPVDVSLCLSQDIELPAKAKAAQQRHKGVVEGRGRGRGQQLKHCLCRDALLKLVKIVKGGRWQGARHTVEQAVSFSYRNPPAPRTLSTANPRHIPAVTSGSRGQLFTSVSQIK